jgi:ribose transport system permease protein
MPPAGPTPHAPHAPRVRAVALLGGFVTLGCLGLAAGSPGFASSWSPELASLAAVAGLGTGAYVARGLHSPLSATLGPLLGVALVILFFGLADRLREGPDVFLTSRNARTICVQASTVGVAALGMTIIIIGGGIDLSAGTALALSATVLAECLRRGYGPTTSILACIAAGVVTGLLNGVLVSGLRLIPFIVTLGTMTAYQGVAKLIARETTVRPPLESIPEWLKELVSTSRYDAVGLALVLAVGLGVVLRNTVFGRYVFALGSNESTTRLCGVNVPVIKVSIYTLAGLFVGVAGVYQFARLSSGNPMSGAGLELQMIASVVIGGGSLSGGRGSVSGTLAGALTIAIIKNGCNLMGFGNPAQDIVIGAIIVAAVALDQLRERGQ